MTPDQDNELANLSGTTSPYDCRDDRMSNPE